MMTEKSNITKPPEEMKEWNGMEWTEGNKILREHAYNKCWNGVVGLLTTKG